MAPRFPASRGLLARIKLRGIGPITLLLLLATTGLATLGATPEAESTRSTAIRYGRDIRPLLSDRCFLCHGPDEAKREAHLRLDVREEATRARKGGAAIVPGDPEGSELWYRILTEDPNECMPPPESHRARFTAEEHALISAWIEQGAVYEEHWAFEAPKRPPLPWAGMHPVDAFVRAALDERGLKLQAPAAPEIALRRLFLDLTGLPPTPEETQAYLQRCSQADGELVWRETVKRLLTEEPYRSRYAERMASPWLDQARYADTSGIHTDAGRQIWPWRDWVLNAYRNNMPFDRFVIEQLAGDLLPNQTAQSQVATGFLRNHVTTDEGGAIDAEYLVEYAVDRVDTTSQVLLGLTVSCARCHDHKFDPISQEDYYRMFAFFASNEEPGLYSQEPDPNRAFEPFLEVPGTTQQAEREALRAQIEAKKAELETPSPADREALAAFRADLPHSFGIAWQPTELLKATSEGGATFTLLPSGIALASGQNPEVDVHRLELRTESTDLRLVQLDVLGDPSFAGGAPGRAGNGNGVLTGLHVTVTSVVDPSLSRTLQWAWVWTDYAQDNEDYTLFRTLTGPNKGWAIGGHNDPRDHVAWLLADAPFGFDGGTDIVVTLEYQSPYAQHTFGKVRVGLGQVEAAGIDKLPVSQGHWYHAGPFPVDNAEQAYTANFGPESAPNLDLEARFEGSGPTGYTYRADFVDGKVHPLPDGVNVHYIARELYSPTARNLEVSIGSDDGFALFVNGARIAGREDPRGAAPDQDRVTLPLQPGRNGLVFKVINTGGQAGFYYRALEAAERLSEDLVAALVELGAFRDNGRSLDGRIAHAWRLSHSAEYRAGTQALAQFREQQSALEATIPRTMVMRERSMPRELFVLKRGQYDQPDHERPVLPGIPAAFGSLPLGSEGATPTRLDLAQWMVSPEHPLFARVAVNRLWQMIFGDGIVRTSGDFGLQGAFPTHPELLDWLAVEFVESGFSVQHMLTLIVTSDTYRQDSATTQEALASDPSNHWLSHFPRHRLDGERIRDSALYVAGLLDETQGGPSVKPYQPDGLWSEVAMVASNTRFYQRGQGSDLWRRSLYTYWKRACPPPAMMTLDAPTREACVVKRATTNTPLQALVLWNDEQFREAARVLAQRTLAETQDAAAGLTRMFQRCTGRAPTDAEMETLRRALEGAETRYQTDRDSAKAWVEAGVAPRPMTLDEAQLAAWTMVASAILNLHATLTNG